MVMALVIDTSAVGTTDEIDSIDDEFFALIYSDEQLLRDEFDALIAAAWTTPPPPADARDRGAEYPPDGPRSGLRLVRGRFRSAVASGVRGVAAWTRAPPDSP